MVDHWHDPNAAVGSQLRATSQKWLAPPRYSVALRIQTCSMRGSTTVAGNCVSQGLRVAAGQQGDQHEREYLSAHHHDLE